MSPKARQDGLLIQSLGKELVVYDQERHRIHSLNPATAFIWRQCDGRTAADDMSALLAAELDLPADEDVVQLALEQLRKAHLLRESVPRGGDRGKVSRRDVLRKLGHLGGVALLLPAISSTTAPTSAIAAQYPDLERLRLCLSGCSQKNRDCTAKCGAGELSCLNACSSADRDCTGLCTGGT